MRTLTKTLGPVTVTLTVRKDGKADIAAGPAGSDLQFHATGFRLDKATARECFRALKTAKDVVSFFAD